MQSRIDVYYSAKPKQVEKGRKEMMISASSIWNSLVISLPLIFCFIFINIYKLFAVAAKHIQKEHQKKSFQWEGEEKLFKLSVRLLHFFERLHSLLAFKQFSSTIQKI